MKFNKQELLNLACQSSNRFVKEGPLVIYERQDGLFKRSEVADGRCLKEKSRKSHRRSSLRNLSCYGGALGRVGLERWCRLRENMLFYFKSNEAWSEPAGVILLDIVNIQVEPVPIDGSWTFTLVMANNGGDQRFAACSEAERDSWIQVLHMASYSYIRAQISSLQSKLEELRANTKPSVCKIEAGEVPVMELTLSCDNLRCDGHGWPPSPQAAVEFLDAVSMTWRCLGQTENVERCSNPTFLVTFPLWSSMGIKPETRLRITVYDVREALSRAEIVMGKVEFPLSRISQDGNLKRRLPLTTTAGCSAGFVTIVAHTVIDLGEHSRNSSNPQSPLAQEENMVLYQHRRTHSLPPRLLSELRRPPQGWISIYFTEPITRTYRFHSGLGGDIVVHESMMESKLNNFVPAQLLRLWINQEKDLVRELVALSQIVKSPWQQRLLQLLERHFRRIGDYSQALESVEAASSFFRPSTQKDKSTLQYCPINLHLQRLWVQNSSLRKEGTYDCVTVGAFTAIPHGFKGGGLLKLLKNFHASGSDFDQVIPAREALQISCQTLRHIQGATKLLLGAGGLRHDFKAIFKIVEALIKRVRSMMFLLDSPLVADAIAFFDKNKYANPNVSLNSSDCSFQPLRSMAERLVQDPTVGGSSFYSANDELEPLDMIQINLEASLLALAGKLQNLLDVHAKICDANRLSELAPGLVSLMEKYGNRIDSAEKNSAHDNIGNDEASSSPRLKRTKSQQEWVTELTPCLNKLLTAAQAVVKTLRISHGIHRLREEMLRSATAHTLQHRRDVCFSQALTAALTALVTRLNCIPAEPELMVLICNAGLLLGVEGLLTPYKAEAGMWSDMAVAIEDLTSVKFLLVPVTTGTNGIHTASSKKPSAVPAEYLPQIHGTRESLQVMIPVPHSVFSSLPPAAIKPGLVEFQLIPVFFNIGVNEQARFAERLGDTSAVNAVNRQSFERLEAYHSKYLKLMEEYFPGKRTSESRMPISTLLNQLQMELATSKIQNIQVHSLADAVVRKMKGLRITCCKSAKDRTGMAVTLEQTNTLANEFDLASCEFARCLSSMRSLWPFRNSTDHRPGPTEMSNLKLLNRVFDNLVRITWSNPPYPYLKDPVEGPPYQLP